MGRTSKSTAAVIGLVSASLVLVAAVVGLTGRSDAGGHNTTGVGGDGSVHGCVINGDGNRCTDVSPQGEGPADDELAQTLPAAVAPQGPGPWPFAVLNTGELGLFVRDSPERQGRHLGLALNRQTLWVTCVAASGFDPEQAAGVGPYWYRTTWPTDRPSEAWRPSSPGDPAVGWAYKGYLFPVGHNGQVPACS